MKKQDLEKLLKSLRLLEDRIMDNFNEDANTPGFNDAVNIKLDAIAQVKSILVDLIERPVKL